MQMYLGCLQIVIGQLVYRFASNSKFYAYQIANVSNDATFILNFVVAYK